MNDEFIRQAMSNGEAGRRWLESIPGLTKKYEQKWSLRVLPSFDLSYNYVAPAERDDGTAAVLKIGLPQDRGFRNEMEALALFNGEGAVKLLEADENDLVMLLERLVPGTPLSAMEDDDEATRVLAGVMKNLWRPLPTGHGFPLVTDEAAKGFAEYRQKFKSADPVPARLVDKAEELFLELAETSAEPVLTHGDLHHDNVLSAERADWLAIDPKGNAAEPAYETAAMIRNPYPKMKDRADLEAVIARRMEILSEELSFPVRRIHQWCLAQTVLSAVWAAGEPKGPEHAVKVAEVLEKIMG